MKIKEVKNLVACGIILEDQLERSLQKNIAIIELAFESLMILDPDVAFSVVQQMNDNINESDVEDQLENVKQYKEKLMFQMDIDLDETEH